MEDVNEEVLEGLEDIPKAKKKRKRRTKAELAKDEYYVTAKEFIAELEKYYASDVISNQLGGYIIKIANGLGRKGNFSGYSYLDDMKGDAIMIMNNALINKNFKLDRGKNPFSYFTTVASLRKSMKLAKENLKIRCMMI